MWVGPDNGFGADMKIIGFRADWEPVSALSTLELYFNVFFLSLRACKRKNYTKRKASFDWL